MGCRLPDAVRSPETFWALLEEARHGIRQVPDERWASAHSWMTMSRRRAR
ncbi:beta-ketoacyl synthase N-terminal-like domain-containing protein [Sorangium sp. So ce315]